MPLIKRPFTLGDLATCVDDPSAATTLHLVPIYALAASGSAMSTPESVDLAITAGSLPSGTTITAGQTYRLILFNANRRPILDAVRTVSAASSSAITFVEIYNSGVAPPDPIDAYVKEGDDANRLDYGSPDDGDHWVYDAGTGRWAPATAGAGDLLSTNNLSDLANPATAFNNIKQLATTTTTGVVELAIDGEAAAGVVVQGNDSRLSDARTPTAHKATHATGGPDALTPGDIGAATAAALTSEAGTRAAADTALQSAIDLKADLVGGVVPSAQIPAIAITDYLGSVASQAAMLALTGQKGDWALRSDLGTTWVIAGSDPTQLSSWQQLNYPTAPVTSVNSQTGAVVLGKADVGLGSVDNVSAASLRDRSTHTGTQALSTISDAGTAAALNHGTAAGNAVRLDPTTAKLPAVDGSLLTNLPAAGMTAYCTVEDQKTVGTHGGTHTSGSDQERTLNTVTYNGSGLDNATLLSGNAVTLVAGRLYLVIARAAVSLVDGVVARVKTTGGTLLLEGVQQYVSNSVGINQQVLVTGFVSVAAGSNVTVKLYTQSESTVNTVGKGNAAASVLGMSVERYASVTIMSAPIPA